MPDLMVCPACEGAGEIPDGEVLPTMSGFPHPNQQFRLCYWCDGDGEVDEVTAIEWREAQDAED